jgi:hypothetical protein
MWTMGGIEATRLTLAPANRPPLQRRQREPPARRRRSGHDLSGACPRGSRIHDGGFRTRSLPMELEAARERLDAGSVRATWMRKLTRALEPVNRRRGRFRSLISVSINFPVTVTCVGSAESREIPGGRRPSSPFHWVLDSLPPPIPGPPTPPSRCSVAPSRFAKRGHGRPASSRPRHPQAPDIRNSHACERASQVPPCGQET